ncbi:hypothetical protein J2T02_001685 [Chitinophaga terrae (ex Kim and Jung 2007)]|uniref:BT_3987 domain-containing protein n=1 Tax=Chitinophaga terrae (ex Kim and Jung 2007) TaxID=408074 RepID=UPI00278885A9|nr:DUF1735 domain-containing protein [Chitinophaga terrae (ex Kim and Jung 2007)]MDQ0106574.1 hypothetical protein [Chitinophaga terrae (ex Kim and Jung 2007)]
MQIIHRYIKIALVIVAATACRKEHSDTVYMPAANKTLTQIISITDQPYELKFVVSLTGADYATNSTLSAANDISVNLVADTALVAAYNAASGTDFLAMPAGSYTVPETATINKGRAISDSIAIVITAKDKLASFQPYLLPIKITQVSGAAADKYQQILYVAISGIADGDNIPLYNRANWKVTAVSTDEPAEGGGNGLGKCAIDDNPSTYWQSKWAGSEPGPPHDITIDMGEIKTLHGIALMNRDFSGSWATDGHGQPKTIRIAISDDGSNWTDNGGFSNLPHPEGQPFTKFFFSTYKTCRYFKVTVTDVYATNSTNIAELGAF